MIIKVFFKVVFAIRKNLRRVPNPIENWADTIDTIRLRLQGPIQTLFTHEDRVISVFETFIGDPDFFKKDYSDGDKVIKEDKHNATLITYMFFLAVVAGTLHTDENQRILNEFGCSVAEPLDDVVPPPPVPPLFNPKDHCDEYRKIFFRTDGKPHGGKEFERKQRIFRDQFSDEQFEQIENACPFIPEGSQQNPRGLRPEVLRPQAFAQGTSASAIGSRAKAGISAQPVPRGLGAITRRGGRRTAGGNVTRKRRTH
jgi:hypothetical protein